MPAGRDAEEDGLNPWAWWLQTPLCSAAVSSPLLKGQIPHKAGSREAPQAAQWRGQNPRGVSLVSRKAYDQATPASVSEDTGLAGLGISLGFALATPVNPGGAGLWERCCPSRSPAAEVYVSR